MMAIIERGAKRYLIHLYKGLLPSTFYAFHQVNECEQKTEMNNVGYIMWVLQNK